MSWMVAPEWAGETAYLLAGGPSMRNVPVHRLRNRCVIAINDSFELAPWADYLYFCDKRWWDTRRYKVRNQFAGRKLVTMTNAIEGVFTLACTGLEGLETDPCAIRHGNNSGYQAINLAYHLGAKRIVLLGYDMCLGRNGETHWNYGMRPEGARDNGYDNVLRYTMLPHFKTLAAPLEAAGVKVFNACPGSALQVWPIVNPRDAL